MSWINMGKRELLTKKYLNEFADKIEASGIEMPDNAVINFKLSRTHFKDFWENEFGKDDHASYEEPLRVEFTFQNGIKIEVSSRKY